MRNITLAKSLLVILALAALACTGLASAVAVDTYYDVTFVSAETIVDPTYGTVQKWTYDITCLNEAPHAVSHVDFGELGIVCNPPASAIVLELCGGDGVTEVDDVDPKLDGGTSVVKLDISIDKGETKRVWFVVIGEWPVGTIEVWIKAATSFYGPATVTGPDCVDTVVPEPATIALMGSLFAALGLFAYKQRKTNI